MCKKNGGRAMQQTLLYYDEIETPLGSILAVVKEDKTVRIDFGEMSDLQEKISNWGKRYFSTPHFLHEPNQLKKVRKELLEYFTYDRKEFSIDIELYGTTFQKKVWQSLLKCIPYGDAWTYKDIAIDIGH